MPTPDTTTPALTLALFGPMQVLVQGQPLPHLRSRQSLWMLALLSLRHPRPVEREWLAGTLWPDSEQSQAFRNLRVVLSELRSALGAESRRLRSPDRHTLLLDLHGAEVDLLRFDAAIRSGTLSALEQAVALYRGPLLEGCHEEWVPQEREAREHIYLQALQRLGDTSFAGGDYAAAVDYYQRAVGIDPWQEAARRGCMEALAKQGDTNAALQVYREFIAFLKEDPKAVPDAQTSALYQRLRTEARKRTGAHAVVTTEVAAVPKVQGYLPHPLTDLVGREDERIEVALLLRRSRLVTLTGVGGIGKTRLARQVASEVVREYADGVWLVALDLLSEERLVIQQIASVLGLKEELGRTLLQSVTEHLWRKRLLLVLDNCEHLLSASTQVAAHLLQECREVRILATSREALGITGETIWSVPALAVPDTEHLPQGQATLLRVLMSYEGIQLFVERAQAVQKSFDLTGNNGRSVAQVCRQLEGIPLAIELAAARVRAMTVEQIASRLEDHLGLLTGGSRAAQSRQQTLRATLDWSYALLSEAERLLLRRLSVFAGGCLLDAAEQVCCGEGVEADQVLDLLTSLVDKSLVLFEERKTAGGRYRLLEMVRQYAAESLQASGEAEQVKTRHRDWFLAFAEAAEPQLKGAEQATRFQQIGTEHDNLRTALAWSETDAQGAEAGLRLASALSPFWNISGDFSEGRALLERALEREGVQEATVARAKALNGAGVLAYRLGDYDSTRMLNEESLTIQRKLGDKAGISVSLNNLGMVSEVQGDHIAARAYYEESLALNREMGDRTREAINLTNLGNIARYKGDATAARANYEESLAIRRELGDKFGIAYSVIGLGYLAQNQGEYATACTYFEESLEIRREIGDRRGVAVALGDLGYVAQYQGEYAVAQAYCEESLSLFREMGERRGIAGVLVILGRVFQVQGEYAAARAYYEESLALSREMGDREWEAGNLDGLGNIARYEGDYAAARTLLEEGKRVSEELGDSTGNATSLNSQGNLEYDLGNFAAARTFYMESVRLFGALAHRLGVAQSLEGMATVMLALVEVEKAACLGGASHALRETMGAPMPFNQRARYNRQVEQARSALGEDAFASAWEEGRALTWEQAVAYALEGMPT